MAEKNIKDRNQENRKIIGKLKKHNVLPSTDLISLEDRGGTQYITIKQLRKIAKERGLIGYSKKSKSDLADFIVSSVDSRKPAVSLLDAPVPDIKEYLPLTPSKYVFTPPSLKSICNPIAGWARAKLNSFTDWLLSYIPPEVKKSCK